MHLTAQISTYYSAPEYEKKNVFHRSKLLAVDDD